MLDFGILHFRPENCTIAEKLSAGPKSSPNPTDIAHDPPQDTAQGDGVAGMEENKDNAVNKIAPKMMNAPRTPESVRKPPAMVAVAHALMNSNYFLFSSFFFHFIPYDIYFKFITRSNSKIFIFDPHMTT